MTWYYNNEEFKPPEDCYGFVYEIENLLSGKKYIGRKYLTKAGYKQVKGKRKKIRKESDWVEYYGSSPQLLKDVEQYGKENFKRNILRICKTRGECNYFETAYIIQNEAILREDYYNEWISAKISRSHIKNLIQGDL